MRGQDKLSVHDVLMGEINRLHEKIEELKRDSYWTQEGQDLRVKCRDLEIEMERKEEEIRVFRLHQVRLTQDNEVLTSQVEWLKNRIAELEGTKTDE